MNKTSARSHYSLTLDAFLGSMHTDDGLLSCGTDISDRFIVNPLRIHYPEQGSLPGHDEDILEYLTNNDISTASSIPDMSTLYRLLKPVGRSCVISISFYLSQLTRILLGSRQNPYNWLFDVKRAYTSKVREQLKGHSSVRAYYDNFLDSKYFDFHIIAESTAGTMANMVVCSALIPLYEQVLLPNNKQRSPGSEITLALQNGCIPCDWNGDINNGKLLVFRGDGLNTKPTLTSL